MQSHRGPPNESGLAAAEIEPRNQTVPPAEKIRRVLVVEDVASQQKLLVTVLKKAGHVVSSADNGQDGIDLFRREAFDIVLMDVQMPGMSGLEAMRAIRAEEAGTRNHVAIVAVTAHALAGDAEQCLAAGADAYLRKPIRLAELMALVKRLTEAVG
jgi:CheY-like chemotaxis protein